MTGISSKPSLRRHKAQCTICAHEKCAEIESAFVNWENTEKIAQEFGLAHRTTIYRHVRFFGLDAKRQRNVRMALERIIERSSDTNLQVNGGTVVAAVQAYAKINAQGQWIDRSETLNLNEVFERMSLAEKEAYAQSGMLPDWFREAVGATEANDPREVIETTESEANQ
jgi:hypothetical protein